MFRASSRRAIGADADADADAENDGTPTVKECDSPRAETFEYQMAKTLTDTSKDEKDLNLKFKLEKPDSPTLDVPQTHRNI